MGFWKKQNRVGKIFFAALNFYLSMEGREGISSSGVTVVGSDAPSDYHVALRTTENPGQVSGSTPVGTTPVTVTPPPPAVVQILNVTRKKRGRPRKYGPDGTIHTASPSPKPISASVPPPVIDFSSEKRGKVRTTGSAGKHHQPKVEGENIGNDSINLSQLCCWFMIQV